MAVNLGWGGIFNAPSAASPPTTPFQQTPVPGWRQVSTALNPIGRPVEGTFGPASAQPIIPGWRYPTPPPTTAVPIQQGSFGSIYAAPSGIIDGVKQKVFQAATDPSYPSRSVELASNPWTSQHVHSSTACSGSFEGLSQRLTSLLGTSPVPRENIHEALNLLTQCVKARESVAFSDKYKGFDTGHALVYNAVGKLGNFIQDYYNRISARGDPTFPGMRFQYVKPFFVIDLQGQPVEVQGVMQSRIYVSANGLGSNPPTGGKRRKTRKLRKSRRATRRKRVSSHRK